MQSLGKRSTIGMISLFRDRYQCLSHVKITGQGRTKEVVIQEMNDILSDENVQADPPFRVLRSNLEYRPSKSPSPQRVDSIPHMHITGGVATMSEGQLWNSLTVNEIKRLMKENMPHRKIDFNQRKLPLIRFWEKFGDPWSMPFVQKKCWEHEALEMFKSERNDENPPTLQQCREFYGCLEL